MFDTILEAGAVGIVGGTVRFVRYGELSIIKTDRFGLGSGGLELDCEVEVFEVDCEAGALDVECEVEDSTGLFSRLKSLELTLEITIYA